LIKNKIIDLFF